MNVLAGALPPDAGTIRIDGQPYRPGVAARREPPRHRADPPGAVALPAPDGRREHPAGPRAGALRASSIRAAADARTSDAARQLPAPRAAAAPHRRGAADRGAAGGRDLPRARVATPHPADGRADEQPAARRRGAPVRADPRGCARRGSASSTSATSSKRSARSPMSSPCCATAAAWPPARLRDVDQRAARRAHGRAAGREPLPASHAARRRARSCSSVKDLAAPPAVR